MPELEVKITTLSPLFAGANKPYGQFLETESFVSGALLRGAVATQLLAQCDRPEYKENHVACPVKEQCAFYRLVPDVAFPTCFPADQNAAATEMPLKTTVTCKHAGGFRNDRDEEKRGHGVFDLLLHHLAYAEVSRYGPVPGLPPLKCRWESNGKRCEAPLEGYGSRYVLEGSGRGHVAPPIVTRRMTHVGINRRRETAEPGLLYSVQAIAEGTVFVGRLRLPDGWDEARVREFKKVLKAVRRLGGGQSRGLGKVEIEVSEARPPGDDVATRMEAFNAKLAEVWSKYAGHVRSAPARPPATYFSVALLTPTILTMPDGAPTLHLTPEHLTARARELGCDGLPPVEAVTFAVSPGEARPLCFAGAQIVSGWSEAWRLPKPTALAIAAGSVFVFQTKEVAAWEAALERIEAHGLGARREEGFGAVRICDPIHQEVKPI